MRGTNVQNASYQRCEHPGFPRPIEGVRRGSGGGLPRAVHIEAIHAVLRRLGAGGAEGGVQGGEGGCGGVQRGAGGDRTRTGLDSGPITHPVSHGVEHERLDLVLGVVEGARLPLLPLHQRPPLAHAVVARAIHPPQVERPGEVVRALRGGRVAQPHQHFDARRVQRLPRNAN
eukprot:1180111-Prorocentrum_minimum.AAC.2